MIGPRPMAVWTPNQSPILIQSKARRILFWSSTITLVLYLVGTLLKIHEHHLPHNYLVIVHTIILYVFNLTFLMGSTFFFLQYMKLSEQYFPTRLAFFIMLYKLSSLVINLDIFLVEPPIRNFSKKTEPRKRGSAFQRLLIELQIFVFLLDLLIIFFNVKRERATKLVLNVVRGLQYIKYYVVLYWTMMTSRCRRRRNPPASRKGTPRPPEQGPSLLQVPQSDDNNADIV